MITALTLLLWIGPSSASLWALKPDKSISNYIHHAWTSRDGLPQDTIYSMVQDAHGFIWLGTDNGLVRFDGMEFKLFNKRNTAAIKNDSITTLFMASDKTLWIGTYGGGVTLYKNNHFYNPMDDLPNNFIQSITEDKENNIWIGTIGGGIIYFNENVFSPLTVENGLSSDIVSSVLADHKGRLWAGTGNGLNCLEHGEFTVYTTNDGLPDNNVRTVFEDSRGNLWIGTPQGIARIKNRDAELDRGSFTTFTTRDGLSGNFVRSIHEDKEGSIWVATDKGLNRIHRLPRSRRTSGGALDRVESFTADDGLSDNSLLSVFEDKWNNLWVGTAGGGLNVLRDGNFSFYGVRDGLTNNHVTTVYEAPEGALWIGTGGGGLNRYKDGKFTSYTERNGLLSNNIQSLRGGPDGSLWIGTTHGLNRYDERGSRKHGFQKHSFEAFTDRNGLSNNDVKTLFRDGDGALWIGTFGGGLNRYKDGKFEVFDQSKGLSNDFVLVVNEDIHGNIWVGTNKGLNRLKDGVINTFTSADGLSEDMIMDIYPDAEGVLWIATKGGGLNRLKDGRFTRFPSGGDEFLNDVIYRVIEDDRSYLWMTSNRGIFAVSRAALNRFAEGKSEFINASHFREEDGLKTSVFTGGCQPAGWKTSEGNIFFPTLKGLTMVDLRRVTFRVDQLPEIIDAVETPAPLGSYITITREQAVVIEKITADGRPLNLQKNVILPSNTETMEFHFRVVNYTASEKVLFKYRLLGYDSHWVYTGGGHKAVYRGLPTGRYTFRVLAYNNFGDWLFKGDSYSFFIDHRFYQSLWFYVLLTSLLVSAVLGIPRFIERRARLRRMEEEKYKGSSLSIDRSGKYLERLITLMETEKPYLDPNLSLRAMAEKLGCSKENLSQVINEKLDLNFKNFLNKYRVEEAKLKLADPKENDFVLMKIAFDAGFNSKSVFNAAFKKFTGMSPSQYRKTVQD